jgi:hypothetical protein
MSSSCLEEGTVLRYQGFGDAITAERSKSRENTWQARVLNTGKTGNTARLPIFEKKSKCQGM